MKSLNFNELYSLYSKIVFNLAFNYVQQIEDAEEITQDVFVAINRALQNFRNEADIKTWIYRITINKSLDYIKAKKRKKRFSFFIAFQSEDIEPLQTAPLPSTILEGKQTINRIYQIINSLPDNQRTAIILNKIEQNSIMEISKIMKLNPKAVESLVQRAKKNILNKLNQTKGK